MATTTVKIAGVPYVVEGIIEEYDVPNLAEARRSGPTRRSQNLKVDRVPVDWSSGLGYARKNHETTRGVSGLRDADAETRFSILSLPYQRVAETGEAGHFRKYFHFQEELYVAEELTYASDAEGGMRCYKFDTSGTNWESAGTGPDANGDNTDGVRIFDVVEWKDQTFWLGCAKDPDKDGASESTETAYSITRTADFSTWEAADVAVSSYVATTAKLRQSNYEDHLGRMLALGDNLIIAVWDSADGRVALLYSTNMDAGTQGSQATVSAIGVVAASATDPVRGLVEWNDPFTAGNPFVPIVSTAYNAYIVDVAGTQLVPLFPAGVLTGAAGDGIMTVGANGALYITKHSGDILELSFSNTTLVVNNVGPSTRSARASGDGLIAARQGYTTFLLGSSPTWLYVAYGGTFSGKKKSILAMEYATGVWHSVYYDDGSTYSEDAGERIWGMVLSTEDDGIERLHWFTEGTTRGPGTASKAYHIVRPSENPVLRGTNGDYKDGGYVEFAQDDGGDPHLTMAVFQALLAADDLSGSTSNEHADIQYGVDGAGWTDVQLSGDFLSGTKAISFGTDGVGVSMKHIQLRLDLKRGSTTANTPKVLDFELQVRQKQAQLRGFKLPINLAKTRNERSGSAPNTKGILSALRAAQTTVTLVKLEMSDLGAIYGELSNRGPSGTREGEAVTMPRATGSRTGIITYWFEEVYENAG